MKKAVIAIIAIIIIVLLALYMRRDTSMAVSDDSFETEAAAILSSPASAQQKIDNLNARLEARRARAAKSGAVIKNPPISPTNLR